MPKRKINKKFLYCAHISLKGHVCYYCGNLGEDKDHVPAISYAEFFEEHERILVRSCHQCNMFLSNKPFHTIHARAQYLLIKYQRRFVRLLKLPIWQEEEIEMLSGTLKNHIINSIAHKELIEFKLRNLVVLIENTQPTH